MSNNISVKLKPGREKPVLHGHPWIFAGAIAEEDGPAEPGTIAEVLSASGEWLARGLIHPSAALRVRIYTRDPSEPLDDSFFASRVHAAISFREGLFGNATGDTDAYRLIFSEADGLSGLIVDRYADFLSVQVGACALVPYLDGILRALKERTGLDRVWVRPEPDAVTREGVQLPGPAGDVPAAVRIRERGKLFDVDVGGGQKTGYFLDQRENRCRVASYARGRRVLSAYCYTGSFEVHAASAGAVEILGIDRSEPALERARRHHELNGTSVPLDYRQGDVAAVLRRFRDEGRTFDLIILDPPRFVASRVQMEKGLRGYKDVNLLALKLLSPGGVLATFSCSGLVSMEHFKRMIGWSSVDAGRTVRIVEQLGQPPDHPVLSTFPESEYLKGLICVVA